MSSPRSKRIGLYGPWGYGNLGCAATLQATIHQIRARIPDAELVCFSLNPADTQERHGVRAYPIGREHWSEYAGSRPSLSMRLANWLRSHPSGAFQRAERWVRRVPLEFRILRQTFRRLKALDVIVVTGGGQLLDFWGGAWTHPYWLVKYALLSRLAGTKLMFLSVGAGPVDSRLSRLFCRLALSLASYRSYRDAASKTFVEAIIGFKREDPVYPDLAYSLPVTDRCQEKQTGLAARAPVVGLGVMTYYDPRYWPENDPAVYRDYLMKMASFAHWLIERRYVVSLLVGESQFDRAAVKDFLGLLQGMGASTTRDTQVIEDRILTVADLLHEIGETDLVVASRFHNVLLGMLLSRPVIALSYHPKIDALMADNGQGRYCMPIDRFDLGTLQERFTDLDRNSAEITRHLAGIARSNRVALEQQYERVFGHR